MWVRIYSHKTPKECLDLRPTPYALRLVPFVVYRSTFNNLSMFMY